MAPQRRRESQPRTATAENHRATDELDRHRERDDVRHGEVTTGADAREFESVRDGHESGSDVGVGALVADDSFDADLLDRHC